MSLIILKNKTKKNLKSIYIWGMLTHRCLFSSMTVLAGHVQVRVWG